MSGELPEAWASAPFAELTTNFDGQRIPVKADDRKKRQGPYPYFGASGIIDHLDAFLFQGSFLLIAEDGANLLSRSTPIAFRATGQFWVNNHAHVMQTEGGIPLEYLELYINTLDLQTYVTGSAQPKLTQAALNRIQVPLAPLAEQQRIVAKVEALLARVHAARQRLAKVPAILKRFRQSVLAAACSGHLTADRRKEHAEIENGEGRLAGWRDAIIGEIASSEPRSIQSGPFGSNLRHSEFQATGVLAIGIDNVLHGRFSMGRQHRISPRKFSELRKYEARPGDVLITVMATVGRVCVVPDDLEPAIITKHVYRITVDRNQIVPKHLMFCLMGDPQLIAQMTDQVRGQTRPGINGVILKSLPVRVPPVAEQHEIVRRVDALFKLADAIEKRVAAATARAEKLTQAILAKAFRGELVATEAELARREGRRYEAAAVLLERIRAERQTDSGPITSKGRRKRSV